MSAANSNHELPGFQVQINRSPLPFAVESQVGSLIVDDDTDLPGMFTLEFTSSEQQTAPNQLIDQALFAIGNAVEVKLGYGDRLTRLIAGEITGLEPEFSFHGLPSLIVRGYDRRHRLQRRIPPRQH